MKIRKPEIKLNFNMSKKKRIALLVLLIIVLIAAGGYVGYMKFLEHTKKTEVLQAMRMKYGSQFKVLSIKTIDETNYNAYLSASDIEGSVITVKMAEGSTQTEDNYVSVRLCHELTEKVKEKLPEKEPLFIHTDNLLDFTDPGEFAADMITEDEYLTVHPDDGFNVSILIDSSRVKPETLRNTLGAMAYSLETKKGNFDVYSVSGEAYAELTEAISKYDSMKRDDVKETLSKEGELILSLSFEEINPPKEQKKEDSKDKAKDKKDVKSKDNG